MQVEKATPADSVRMTAVGFVKSPYRRYDEVRHRHAEKGWTAEASQIALLPRHARKLGGLEGYSHVIVIYWIDRAGEWRMPKNHGKPPHVKLFATRMPKRPNPIGISVVEVVSFSATEGRLEVKGLDALDETPVLDIKPYIPHFDSFPDASVPPWLSEHMARHHGHHDHDHSSDAGRTG